MVAWSFGRAEAQTVKISVDATAPGQPIERIWPFYGYDEVNYSTTAEGEALLKSIVQAHTAPVHIRTHFLLNTGNGTPSLKWGSTNVYTQDAAGNPIYSWTLIDGIMDAITGAGAFPLTEIAFMPEALSTHPTPYMNSGVYTLDGGCFYPPNDYTKWSNLIKAWATHVNARYPNVAGSWLWEMWNEPNIGYWHGTFADYAKLYDTTEAALHSVIPTAQLGGPAVTAGGVSFLPQFLQHCATGTNAVTGKTGTRLDLVTFHAKGGAAVVGGHVEMNLGNQLRIHRDGFNAVAAVAQFKQTPIFITEADPDGCAACSASSTPADAYRNSPTYGVYEIAMMKRTLELEASLGVKVGGLITWAFAFPGTPYFPGYRALQTNGIDLPVFADFKLLGKLAGLRLPVTSTGAATLAAVMANGVRGNADVDGMATLNGQSVQVLAWNYHDDEVTVAATPVQISVMVPAAFGSAVTVSHVRVDSTHGDAYTVWTAQGSPKTPSAGQIIALKQGMDPEVLNPPETVAVSGGAVSLSFDLPRFGVSLLTLTPAEAVPDASVGMSDASSDGGSSSAAGGSGGAEGGGQSGATTGSGGTTGGTTGGASGATTGGSGAASSSGGHAGGGPSQTGSGGAAGVGGATARTASDASGCSCAVAALSSQEWLFPRLSLVLVGLAVARVRRSSRRRA